MLKELQVLQDAGKAGCVLGNDGRESGKVREMWKVPSLKGVIFGC